MLSRAVVLALTSLVACRDSGDRPDAYPRTPLSECATGACALAVDATTDFVVSLARANTAEVTPADVATVTVTDDNLAVTAHAEGTALLVVDTKTGERFDLGLETAAIATAALEVRPGVIASYDRVFAGTRMHALVRYRAADGAPLVGHRAEVWEATGATLAPDEVEPGTINDPILVRRIDASGGPVHVTAGAGIEPLDLDVAPAGSTATITTPNVGTIVRDGVIGLNVNMSASLELDLHDADGRSLYGIPPSGFSVVTSDPSIATVTVDEQARQLRVEGRAAGSTNVDITADGVTARFVVRIR